MSSRGVVEALVGVLRTAKDRRLNDWGGRSCSARVDAEIADRIVER